MTAPHGCHVLSLRSAKVSRGQSAGSDHATGAISKGTRKRRKKNGNRGSPEVLNEVKVNQNLVLFSKTLLFIVESLHPLGITHCIR